MHVPGKHERALDSYRRGRFDDAVHLLGEALHERETSELWNDWASAQIAARRIADAERGLRRALELNPDNLDAAANLGALLAASGRYSEALRFLEQSESRLAGEEKNIVQRLLTKCRQTATDREPKPADVPAPAAGILRALSLQTSALNHMLLRLLAIENLLAGDGHEQPMKSSSELRSETNVIPKIAMSRVLTDATEIRLRAPAPGIPSVTLPELCLLIHLLRRSQARIIFEFGTYVGRTTLNFALNSGKASRIYTLDFPSEKQIGHGYSAGSLFARTRLKEKITQLYGESSSFDFSKYFSTADFIFIDASHTYEHALSDSLNALKLLRGGRGTIVWHDYGWQGVAPVLHKLYRDDKRLAGMRHIEDTTLVYAEVGAKRSHRVRTRVRAI